MFLTMSLLHIAVLVVAVLVCPLLALLGIQVIGVGVMKAYRLYSVAVRRAQARAGLGKHSKASSRHAGRQKQRGAGSANQSLLADQQQRVPPFWTGLSLAGAVATLAWLLLHFPTPADLQRLCGQLFGYQATRISIALQRDDAAARRALLDTFTPLLQAESRRIRHGGGGHTTTADVVSHYRFIDGRFEIAAGGVIPADRLTVLSYGLQALSGIQGTHAIPTRVTAQLQLPNRRVHTDILLRTATLITDVPSMHPLAERCYLRVWALLPGDVARTMLATAQAPDAPRQRRITLTTQPPLRVASYTLLGVRPGRFGIGDDPLDQPTSPMQVELQLLPQRVDPQVMACEVALPRATDPLLMAAATLNTFPALNGHVAGVETVAATAFSPWYGRGWIAVPTIAPGNADDAACDYQQRRKTDALLDAIHAGCNEPGADSLTCAIHAARQADASKQLQGCLAQ